MPDFPGSGVVSPKYQISCLGPQTTFWDSCAVTNITANTGAVWPSGSRALLCPFYVEFPVTAQKMGAVVITQSGNYDVGIYDEKGNKIVTKGTTAVPVAGLLSADIADTTLNPGTYFMAMSVDNATASFARANPQLNLQRLSGIQEMASAFVLPTTITLAIPSTNYFPLLFIQCGSVL